MGMTLRPASAVASIFMIALVSWPVQAFEVGEFKSGMDREQVRHALTGWRFDKVQNSGDALLAYDRPEKNSFRQFRFHFCNDRLVGLEQGMKASVRNFIVIASNYLQTYGQPMKVDAGVNVVASGEKNAMAMHWRRGNETLGVRYQILAGGEDLQVVHEVSNTCWQAPRSP
jgi:hypothetical protein